MLATKNCLIFFEHNMKGQVLRMRKNAKSHLTLQQLTDNMVNVIATRQSNDHETQTDSMI